MAAKPDLDDGWLPYAHELDAALAVADFTKGARIVLREVFAQIFGPAKLKTARVVATDVAARSGFKRPNVSRAIKELTDSRVLTLESDGAFRFNKDYESWLMADGRNTPDDTPRLTPEEASYCRHATATALAYKNGFGAQKCIQRDTPECIQPDTGVYPVGYAKRIPLDTQSVSNGIRENAAPYRNGRGIELKKEEGRRIASQSQPEGERANGEPSMTVEELIAQVEAVFGRPALTAEVKRNLGSIIEKLGDRLDCFLAGLKQAKRSRTRINNVIGFAIYQGTTYRRTGIPPEPMEFVPEAVASKSKPNNYDDILAGMED